MNNNNAGNARVLGYVAHGGAIALLLTAIMLITAGKATVGMLLVAVGLMLSTVATVVLARATRQAGQSSDRDA